MFKFFRTGTKTEQKLVYVPETASHPLGKEYFMICGVPEASLKTWGHSVKMTTLVTLSSLPALWPCVFPGCPHPTFLIYWRLTPSIGVSFRHDWVKKVSPLLDHKLAGFALYFAWFRLFLILFNEVLIFPSPPQYRAWFSAPFVLTIHIHSWDAMTNSVIPIPCLQV